MKRLDKVKAFFGGEESMDAYFFSFLGAILFVVIMFGLWGVKWRETNTNIKTVLGYEYSAETVVYDKCEYAVFEIGESRYIVHKGNCNNPVHAGKTGKEDAEK